MKRQNNNLLNIKTVVMNRFKRCNSFTLFKFTLIFTVKICIGVPSLIFQKLLEKL